MNSFVAFFTLCLVWSTISTPLPKDYVYDKFPFVSREEWGARDPVTVNNLSTPVPYVIIHHSYIPGACFSFDECANSMRSMQNFHQLDQKWDDIGYNFAVGSDGVVYEGRGWTAVGAHAFGWNFWSIGIVLIGDWVSEVPPLVQLEAAKNLIRTGVELGYISSEYELIGHRQTVATECPGEALYTEISTWERFQPNV